MDFYAFMGKFKGAKMYKMHIICKNIYKKYYLHSFSYVNKNMKLLKDLQFNNYDFYSDRGKTRA